MKGIGMGQIKLFLWAVWTLGWPHARRALLVFAGALGVGTIAWAVNHGDITKAFVPFSAAFVVMFLKYGFRKNKEED